jgi:LacI family transcriptional regulator
LAHKRPTITTVAELANVSVASASRALNGIRTTPEVYERVVEVAARVGYVPNAAARSLRSRRTGQVAFAMPDVANPVYTAMVASIQEVLHTGGRRLVLHSTGADVAEELTIVRELQQHFVDGLILVSLRMTETLAAEVDRAPVPVVVIGRASSRARVDTVQTDSRAGAADAVRHLFDAGRRRIALVNGPSETVPAKMRHDGYVDALRSCGLDFDERLVEVGEDFSVEPGRAATVRLLERERPDAIFCANDLIATGALTALHDAQLEVPGDVAVVGMDNTYLCDVVYPRLTSVDLGASRRGQAAAELLMKRIEFPRRRTRIIDVPPTLVVRETCGARAS